MGFCSSYAEVIRFEKNAADCVEPDVLVGNVNLLGMSVLSADNVDHNIITIDNITHILLFIILSPSACF